MGLLLFIIVAVVLAYFAAPLWAWFVVLGLFLLGYGAAVWWWVPVIVLAAVFLIKKVRVQLVTKPLFAMLKSKGLLPNISDTEKTALRAGDVWIEGELFSGKPDFPCSQFLSVATEMLSMLEKIGQARLFDYEISTDT